MSGRGGKVEGKKRLSEHMNGKSMPKREKTAESIYPPTPPAASHF